MMSKVLLYFSLKYNGNWNQIYEALDRKETIVPEKLKGIEAKIKCKYITVIDDGYPQRLKKIYKPPFVLFYYGNLKKIEYTEGLTVIGSHDASTQGLKNTDKIVKKLKNYTIISGFSDGINSQVHKSAFENQIKIISIMGTGIEYTHFQNNKVLYQVCKRDGLIISEYPNQIPPTKLNFKIANRLIAGLGDGVVVIEAKSKSGVLNISNHALEQGKNIFCFPSNDFGNSESNQLIKDGAQLVESAEDIIAGMKKIK